MVSASGHVGIKPLHTQHDNKLDPCKRHELSTLFLLLRKRGKRIERDAFIWTSCRETDNSHTWRSPPSVIITASLRRVCLQSNVITLWYSLQAFSGILNKSGTSSVEILLHIFRVSCFVLFVLFGAYTINPKWMNINWSVVFYHIRLSWLDVAFSLSL